MQHYFVKVGHPQAASLDTLSPKIQTNLCIPLEFIKLKGVSSHIGAVQFGDEICCGTKEKPQLYTILSPSIITFDTQSSCGCSYGI